MNTPTPAASSKAVMTARAEASAWITRLHGPNRTEEMEAGFRRWLSERPENKEEFEGLTEVWDLVSGGVPGHGVPRLERWERFEALKELKALRKLQALRAPVAPRTWTRAALVLLTCALATVTIALGTDRIWPGTDYSTEIGEQRIVQLSDGTRLSLNSNSQAAIAFDDTARRVRLKRGEAYFEVAKATTPFIVIAGDHRVTALGTSFVVRYDPDLTAITLVEGKVAVGHADSDTPAPMFELTPGERLTLAKRTAPKLDIPRLETVTAWRRGEVILDDTPLIQAVNEMNRYGKTTIVIDSPDIANLIVSGLYHTGDSEGFARSVAKMYRLHVSEDEGRIHLGQVQ
jgi:transmembrane sensor